MQIHNDTLKDFNMSTARLDLCILYFITRTSSSSLALSVFLRASFESRERTLQVFM